MTKNWDKIIKKFHIQNLRFKPETKQKCDLGLLAHARAFYRQMPCNMTKLLILINYWRKVARQNGIASKIDMYFVLGPLKDENWHLSGVACTCDVPVVGNVQTTHAQTAT